MIKRAQSGSSQLPQKMEILPCSSGVNTCIYTHPCVKKLPAIYVPKFPINGYYLDTIYSQRDDRDDRDGFFEGGVKKRRLVVTQIFSN